MERRLFERGGAPIVLDGTALQSGLNADLGDATVLHLVRNLDGRHDGIHRDA